MDILNNTIGMFSKKFDSKFKFALREIYLIELEISQKKGKFFESHTYSKEQLNQHVEKVISILEKIKDDAENWGNSGQLNSADIANYEKNFNKVQEALYKIREEIIKRPPTFWENLLSDWDDIIIKVTQNLRLDDNSMIIKFLPKPVQRIVKLISFQKNNADF
jgi:FtsZ-binding cell division protein ZapB